MEGISLHSFPRDPKVCEKWTKAIGRGGKITFSATNPTVCSAHFRSSDFFGESHKRKWRLKRGAVPSIFAWKTGVEERQPLKKTEIGSEPHDTMDCELPGSVELKQDPFEAIYIKHEPVDNPDTINKDLLDSTNPVPINMKIFNPDTTNKDLLESSKQEPVNVKRFKHETANEDLLVKTSIKVEPFDVKRFKHEPEFEETATFLSDSLVSEYIVPTVDSELIKIVDIQDIFNQKTNQLEVSGSETSTANPTIKNVASMSSNVTGSSNTMLQPPIVPNLHKNERETSNSKLVPKNHPNDLYLHDQREITDLDILKNGACLRCKECKRIVSDITSAKVHKCPPRSRNFKCMICNSSFLSVSDLKNHISLEHPNN
ncbi:hypothetical protein B566_EDAN006282 [Ephemera danica]|nr:hypothetical protein B566_EDAN006282 [Ephemera danica]